MKSRWILFVLIVAGCVFFIGCAEESGSGGVVCNKPYIQAGTDCCLDQNDNSVCDSDEGATAIPTPTAKKTYMVIATGERVDGDTVKVTYHGGQDSDQVSGFIIDVYLTKTVNSTWGRHQYLENKVGSTLVIDYHGAVPTDKLHIIVVATFKDGTTQVILETDV